MSRKSRQRKKRKRREEKKAKVKVAYHQCACIRAGCEDCPHAEPHLVELHEGGQACGGFCMHHDIDMHCVQVGKGFFEDEVLR